MKALIFSFLMTSHIILLGQQLVLPGDHPDPSVIKIGNTYYASATTSNWAPAFPILQSNDMVTWSQTGYIFPSLPSWADYYFWAPELSYEDNKVYVYYTAHKRDGNLCIAIASADDPKGPYVDHGPLICQPMGSIDAFPMRDNNNKLYLVWKEDGNSINQPTPIWAIKLSEDRKSVIGEKQELFRNDVAWESNLVEGVSMIKHNGYYYAFYAAAGCCGRACTYGIGVARSKDLLGPWEKYGQNPITQTKTRWKCPGHGTPVEKDGKFYFLYHAYDSGSNVYTGRQGILSEFEFTSDNWIRFKQHDNLKDDVRIPDIYDGFDADSLSILWQWSVFQKINYELKDNKLILNASTEKSGSFIGQKVYSNDYDVSVILNVNKSNAEGGLALIGDDRNMVAITYANSTVKVVKLENNEETIIQEVKISPKKLSELQLKLIVSNGKDIDLFYALKNNAFKKMNQEKIDGYFLPPWDRGLRVGLVSKGTSDTQAVFDNFVMKNNK